MTFGWRVTAYLNTGDRKHLQKRVQVTQYEFLASSLALEARRDKRIHDEAVS